jgi:hypothetical protein
VFSCSLCDSIHAPAPQALESRRRSTGEVLKAWEEILKDRVALGDDNGDFLSAHRAYAQMAAAFPGARLPGETPARHGSLGRVCPRVH